MIKKLKLLSFGVFLITFNSYCNLTSIKNIIGKILTFPIASNTISKKIKNTTKEISKEIDPNVEITDIKKLNKLGQFLIGYQNTIAIPFLNFVILNDKWLKKLPEESRKFVIGRCVTQLSNSSEYLMYKYLLPFALYNFLRLTIPKNFIQIYPGNGLPANFDKLASKLILLSFTKLVTSYFSRNLEYQADAETAYKLKNADFAIRALKDLNKFRNDKTILGSISSKIPFFKLLNLILLIKVAKKNLKLYDILFATIDPKYVLNKIESNIPGRITNASNSLENFCIHLPIINWFCNFPRISDRIKYLRKVAKK